MFHVELTGRDGVLDHRPGTGWLVERLVQLNNDVKPCVIVVDARSPAASLLPALEEAGLSVTADPARGTGAVIVATGASDMARACGAFYDAVSDTQNVRHIGQGVLDAAVEGAVQRPLGDAWAYSRKTSTTNISPLVSVTLALHGLTVYGLEQEPVTPWMSFG